MNESKLEWTSVWGKEIVFEDLDAARARLLRIETQYAEAEEFWHSDAGLALSRDEATALEVRLEQLAIEGSVLEAQIEDWEKQAA